MKKIGLFFAMIIFFSTMLESCKSPKTEQQAIQEMEDALMKEQSGVLDEAMAEEMIKKYVDFVNKNFNHELSPGYLFKAADISVNMNQPNRGVKFLDDLEKNYPAYEKMPEVLFLKAFVYENYMSSPEKAKEIYLDFLNRYPEHELADEVKVLIMNVGKSPEELFKEFEAKNQQPS